MATKTKRSQETPRARYWRGVIKDWEGSGLTQAEFCCEEGVSLPSFRWWRWRLRKLDQQDCQPEFLPVRVIEKGKGYAENPSQLFEITVQERFSIRVPADFDSQALLRLLKVVEEATC